MGKRKKPLPEPAPVTAPEVEEPRVLTGDLELGRHYGVTTKTVYDWRMKGMPARSEGRLWVYDLDKTDAWVDAQRATPEVNESAALAVDLRRAKVRAEQAKASRLEREEQAAAGDVLPRGEYELFATEVIQEARDRLLRIPRELRKQICRKCQGKLPEVVTMIEEALADLAKLGEGPECER